VDVRAALLGAKFQERINARHVALSSRFLGAGPVIKT
jgi:hypothetical protein